MSQEFNWSNTVLTLPASYVNYSRVTTKYSRKTISSLCLVTTACTIRGQHLFEEMEYIQIDLAANEEGISVHVSQDECHDYTTVENNKHTLI